MDTKRWGMDAESRLFFRREARYFSCVALLALVVHCALVTGRSTVLVGSKGVRVGIASARHEAVKVHKAVKALCRW